MTRRSRFFTGVVFLSPAVFLIWHRFVKAPYSSLLREAVSAVWRGVEPVGVNIPSSIDNVVPFLVLMLATPGVGPGRRMRGLACGIGILLIAHILVAVFTTRWVSNPVPSQLDFFLSLLSSTVMVALPFLIWVVLTWQELKALVVAAPDQKSQ